MIIIWQGLGILVPLVIGGSIFGAFMLVKVLKITALIEGDPSWILAIGLFLAGFVNSMLGRKVNFDRFTTEDALGRATKRALVHNDHTFFWIPIQHWSWVCFAICLLVVYTAMN